MTCMSVCDWEPQSTYYTRVDTVPARRPSLPKFCLPQSVNCHDWCSYYLTRFLAFFQFLKHMIESYKDSKSQDLNLSTFAYN